jgi:hypothetical protein
MTTERFKELLGSEADGLSADALARLHDQMARLAVQIVTVANHLHQNAEWEEE